MDRPIFILGAHKSGTSLLRSLFDSHPALFAVPIESHFFQNLEYWIDYPFLERIQPRQISTAQLVTNLKAAIAYSNTEENPQGDGISKGIFDQSRFDTHLETHLQPITNLYENLALCFEIYLKAIFYSIHGTDIAAKKRFLEKSVEAAELALELQQLFPDALFIHILRNPYANLVSMRKFRMHNKKTTAFPWLGLDYRSLYNSLFFLYKNKRLISNYLVVKYEDLIMTPQTTLQSICEFVDLEFSKSLLQPTYLGQPWFGNSSATVKFQGISAARLHQWQTEISPLEIKLINKYLRHVVEDFGYDVVENQTSILQPFRQEYPKEYVANRFLWAAG
jgi:protein-tyrosine sulfotransferase